MSDQTTTASADTKTRTAFSATRALGYAALNAESPIVPFTFERREVRPDDVRMEILYTGVCHSDIHQAHNDWKNSTYPPVWQPTDGRCTG